jgi:integrase/recombinase XerD
MFTNYCPEPDTLHSPHCALPVPYLNGFAAALIEAGYKKTTMQDHLRAAVHLCNWQRHRERPLIEVSDTSLAEFRQHLQSCRCKEGRHASAREIRGATLFLRHLQETAVIASPDRVVAGEDSRLFVGFCEWMRDHRGATNSTLAAYGRIVIDAIQSLGDNPQQYVVAALRTFALDRANRHGISKAKLVMTVLRTFLRYLIAAGECPIGLDAAIPTVANWRLSALPRYMPATDVERVVAACDPTTVAGARDRAIVLLLSRLGMRGGDIVALRLRDIDWAQSVVRVLGKSRREALLPLAQEVGDAVLHYLDHARPATKSDRVFLTVTTPVGAFTSTATVSDIVRRAILRAGVSAPAHGTHVLRHSAATALLSEGASLDSIGVLLRHRSIETTAHYAKVDINRLRQLAQPWPEVSPC